ncbi:pilus assembly protein TadG-related protein [Yoonia vestfoldensis]|uniref:Putative Flp pilus-assembly TadE/G-like protein n=1 Tax=Yoonia vestfoldensis TaxID=245188 RepID=A0A1Y0EDG4_9RHOB|nr:VWA domain-containing protein [Yoonia vestfoldensis]ARU01391.1 putative Flp pilus-assembly TadE/G-like protein [Yoonia vestfoldensis]
MQIPKTQVTAIAHNPSWRARYLRRFGRDEDGSIIILTILLLITMLILGGMAVDFMRYEARRATLQSVSDRAVLAAASLNQQIDPGLIVEDYFAKAGFADALRDAPVVVDNGNSRSVTVRSALDVDTFYLRLAGMDRLTAPAQASATEGVGKVEIALVLDISGSMRFSNRFANMQAAAIAFAEEVLDPANGGTVSLTIIPYAGATNPGPEMFAYMGGVRYPDTLLPGDDGILGTEDDYFFPQVSSCVEMEGSDWSTTGLPAAGRPQVPHFQTWDIAPQVMDWGWCPQDKSSIQYALASAAQARTFINNLRMHDGTGTHYAMKYALAALDPSSQPAFQHLSHPSRGLVPPEFANRPAAWDDPETKKIIVLMTDGQITVQERPRIPQQERDIDRTILQSIHGKNNRGTVIGESTNVARFEAICTLANEPARHVDVYTVAFEVPRNSPADRQMRGCASDPSMFFRTSGAELIEVFSGIAERITDLRLNL